MSEQAASLAKAAQAVKALPLEELPMVDLSGAATRHTLLPYHC